MTDGIEKVPGICKFYVGGFLRRCQRNRARAGQVRSGQEVGSQVEVVRQVGQRIKRSRTENFT